ncbi:MAG: hypothetical protein RI920_546 [Pseudomonadota bacterium]|jgi:hypothetical protein
MAIYHLSIKPIQRSAGRSATAAAAYRAGCKVVDERTGEIHDYTRKGGVLSTRLILPDGGTADRSAFWNKVEAHHKHPRAVTAREIVLALPKELTAAQRRELAEQYGRDLADRYGIAVDVCLHGPDEDNDNWHAHVLMSACACSPTGELGTKVTALDPISSTMRKTDRVTAAEVERPRWESLANAALERAGHDARIDHRSHATRGLDDAPTVHVGRGLGFKGRAHKNKRIAWYNTEIREALAERALLVAEEKIAAATAKAKADAEQLATPPRPTAELQNRLDLVERNLVQLGAKTSGLLVSSVGAVPAAQQAAAKARLAAETKAASRAAAAAATARQLADAVPKWRPLKRRKLTLAAALSAKVASTAKERLEVTVAAVRASTTEALAALKNGYAAEHRSLTSECTTIRAELHRRRNMVGSRRRPESLAPVDQDSARPTG